MRPSCIIPLLAAVLSACAAAPAFAGQDFQVASDPPSADVRTTAGGACVTPCTLAVPVGEDFVVTVSKPGYVPREVPVRALTGAYGGVVDHAPNPLVVALRPMPPVRVAAPRDAHPAHARAAAGGTGASSRDVSLVGDGYGGRRTYVGVDDKGYVWREDAPPPVPRSWSSEAIRTIGSWETMR